MCGVGGYVLRLSSGFPPVDLSSARQAMSHRGPDDSGTFEDPEHMVGLVHTRLSILDLSPSGHQPMISKDGRVALVFNGEIYNFNELRADLEVSGHKFMGSSDTEVLLHLYLEWRNLGRLTRFFGPIKWHFCLCDLGR